jgi:hypothetical protein
VIAWFSNRKKEVTAKGHRYSEIGTGPSSRGRLAFSQPGFLYGYCEANRRVPVWFDREPEEFKFQFKSSSIGPSGLTRNRSLRKNRISGEFDVFTNLN